MVILQKQTFNYVVEGATIQDGERQANKIIEFYKNEGNLVSYKLTKKTKSDFTYYIVNIIVEPETECDNFI